MKGSDTDDTGRLDPRSHYQRHNVLSGRAGYGLWFPAWAQANEAWRGYDLRVVALSVYGEFAHPKSLDNYLQCAGIAECMTVELRVTPEDGSHTHWVLGRGPLTGGETERVVWDTGETMVHPEEVWTAEQAAPLFEQYARERTVPDWVHRRELDI